MSYQVLNGDALTMLKALPSESVNCIVTSPPYYGLRDYGHDGQIGIELNPEYVSLIEERMSGVTPSLFAEAK
ncbi:MAG: hypothetical protein ACK4NQ_01595 [Fimbriimonadaceae bacterium]